MPLFHPHPVGMPGLAAFVIGGILFFALLIRTIAAARGGGGDKKSALSRLGIAVQAAAFAIVGVGAIRPELAPTQPRALLAGAAVAVLMAGAVLLFHAASRAMGANWSVAARVRDDHALVTSGIFARLRHPIYTGMACFLAAEAVAFGHYGQLVLGVPLFLLGTALRVAEEERLLRDRFGAAYDAYAAKVSRFVPGVV